MNIKEIPIIFIVSRGRSGSTLLQSILDAHPNICAPLESKFVLHLSTKYKNKKEWDKTTIKQFIKDIFTNRKFRLFWKVTPTELDLLFKKHQIESFSDACKVIYLSYHSMFEKEEIKLIIDKNPLHALYIPEILNVFPNAKFIHLIRDPRASSYSHIKANMQKNILIAAYDWRIYNEKIESIKSLKTLSFFTIKYENLVSSPLLEFKKIFDFVKISFYPCLLNANSTIKKNYKNNKYLSLPHHKNITKPITKSKINLWKSELTHKEIEIISRTLPTPFLLTR